MFLRIPKTTLLGIAASQPVTSCTMQSGSCSLNDPQCERRRHFNRGLVISEDFFKETTEQLLPETVDSYRTDRLMHQTFTYLKTPFFLVWCITFSPGQEIPNLYGTRNIITAFTKFIQQTNNATADFTPQHKFTKMRFNITFSSMPMYL